MSRHFVAAGRQGFWNHRKRASIPAGSPGRKLRPRRGYDGNKSGLESDSVERSPTDAPTTSLAGPLVVPHANDRFDARGRWLALVCARPDSAAVWRRPPLRSNRVGHCRRCGGNLLIPRAQANEPAQETLRNRTPLLGGNSSSGQILLSVGPFHYRLCGRDVAGALLSGAPNLPARRSISHCGIAYYPGHAFPERRARRLGHRSDARHHQFPHFRRPLGTGATLAEKIHGLQPLASWLTRWGEVRHPWLLVHPWCETTGCEPGRQRIFGSGRFLAPQQMTED